MGDELIPYDDREDIAIHGVVQGYVIETKKDYDDAGTVLQMVKTRFKQLEEARKIAVQPLNKLVSETNAKFRPAQDRLEGIEATLKKMMGAFALKQREEQQQLLLASQKAAVAQVPDAALAFLQKANETVVPSKAGISVRKVWKWELIDDTKVPETFKSVDPKKLDAAVKAGIRDIPGVRVFEDSAVTVRTAK